MNEVNLNAPAALRDFKILCQAQAQLDHAELTQYVGAFSGPEWQVVSLRSDVMSKAGRAFFKGDQTIARAVTVEPEIHRDCVEVYCPRNKCSMIIGAAKVKFY